MGHALERAACTIAISADGIGALPRAIIRMERTGGGDELAEKERWGAAFNGATVAATAAFDECWLR